jgi:DNA-binding response OmpR family regulator
MKVLVIEDSPDLRNYLRLALEALGHAVATAENGRAALSYLARDGVDVMLTDLFMPEMDGIEIISTVRREFPRVRIIAMSGRPGVDYLAVAQELGAARILRKPFEMDQLMSALEAA